MPYSFIAIDAKQMLQESYKAMALSREMSKREAWLVKHQSAEQLLSKLSEEAN